MFTRLILVVGLCSMCKLILVCMFSLFDYQRYIFLNLSHVVVQGKLYLKKKLLVVDFVW